MAKTWMGSVMKLSALVCCLFLLPTLFINHDGFVFQVFMHHTRDGSKVRVMKQEKAAAGKS